MVTTDDTTCAASSTIPLVSVDINSSGDNSSGSQVCSMTDVAKFSEKQSDDSQSDAQGNCRNVLCPAENNSCNDIILSTDYSSESVTEGYSTVTCLEAAKSTLKVQEFKQFLIDCITAVKEGKDVIIVQPTGSGKSVCFVLPALMFPG